MACICVIEGTGKEVGKGRENIFSRFYEILLESNLDTYRIPVKSVTVLRPGDTNISKYLWYNGIMIL